ncbi:MAG TPA: LysR family transcriptional regulator [Steroidobacter sp.]
MDRFLCAQAFITVAERQSFSEAARQLGVTPSVITSRVKQLEQLMRAPLFHRSTRSVTLSEAGKACFEEFADLIRRFEAVADGARQRHETPVGSLRLQVLPDFAGHLGRELKGFRDAYPQIEVDITVSSEVRHPVDGGFDISLQIFHATAEALIERPLFRVRRLLCASPEYVSRCGMPTRPADLLEHELGLSSSYPTRNRWSFSRKGEEKIWLDLPSPVRSDSVDLLRDFALSGGGITCLPSMVCSEHVLNGGLVPVLPDFELPPLDLLAIFPVTHRRAVKVRVFIDYLARRFSGELEWDRALRLHRCGGLADVAA